MSRLQETKAIFQQSSYSDAGRFFENEISPSTAALRYEIPITECRETLIPIPKTIRRHEPHPYEAVGAPYDANPPYSLRETVLTKLSQAQAFLSKSHPGYQLQIFDAYRPLAVQAFMINHECKKLAQARGYDPDQLTPQAEEACLAEVRRFWAAPNTDPATPPPHSTGAAIDLTIIDDAGQALDMGVPIDHVGPESFPHHFENKDPRIHTHRQLLYKVMHTAGFRRLPYEWWHFSYGDQWWALLEFMESKQTHQNAIYGRFEVAT